MKSLLGGPQARALLLLWLAVLMGCGPAPDAGPPNILLVTIDTLRADHLSFHGYPVETTPRISEWIDEATVFERAYSPIPLTEPSITSLMTGFYPVRHGIRQAATRPGYRYTTLAETLQREGYETAAFVSRDYLLRGGGLLRGFETANYIGGDGDPDAPWLSPEGAERWQRRAPSVTDATLEWLRERNAGEGDEAARPWFVWLHYFDPHAYYDPPEELRAQLTPREVERAVPDRALRVWWGRVANLAETVRDYDAEILYVDREFARVTDHLERSGSWDKTLTILTADHGESLGEHGYMDHGEWLYEEQLHVPLAIRNPQQTPPPRRVAAQVRLIDIAPTILEMSGLAAGENTKLLDEMDGRSMLPLMRGEAETARPVFAESENCPKPAQASMAPGMICGPPGVAGKLRAVIHGGWKLIVTPRPEGRRRELFHLAADPREQTNLAESEPERLAELERLIDAFWTIDTPDARVDPAMRDALRSLGYID